VSLVWVQGIGVAVTLIAAVLAAWNAHSANRSQSDVQHRTVSLDEMEKALKFTGEQLESLRGQVREQADEIIRLDEQHQQCERDKRRLDREIGELRRKVT
jgi:septal ring factor EnvC (AmiA/AmiB activator)